MRTFLVLLIVGLQPLGNAHGGVASQTAKFIGRTLGKAGGRKAAQQAAKEIAEEAAERALREGAKAAARKSVVQAARRFGQAAARSSRFADDLAQVTVRLTPRANRRLLMLAPELGKTGQSAVVMRRLAASAHADDVIARLWAHRGKLTTAAAVATVLMHGDDVVEAGGKYVAKPIIEGSMDHVVAPLTTTFVRLLWLIIAISCGVAALKCRRVDTWLRVRAWLRRIAARVRNARKA